MKHFTFKTLLLLCALIVGSGNVWGQGSETFTAGTDTGTSSVTKGVVTVSMSTMNRTDNYRTNSGTNMTVEVSSGYLITEVVVTCTTSGTSTYGPGKFSSADSNYSYSTNDKIGTWSDSNGAPSVTLSASAQVRMTQIVVTYISSGSTPTTYAVNFDAGAGTFVGNSDFPDENNSEITAGNHTLPSATRTGYTFDGWVVGNNQPVTGIYNVSNDVAFTASYTLGYCATYAVSSTSAVTTSGATPSSSSATFSQTYTTAKQLTSGKNMTLTLSGYEGKRVKRIVLSMKSNGSSGAGWMYAKAGTTTLASIGSSGNGVAFSNSKWNGAYSTSYGDVEIDMSNTTYDIQEDEDVVVYIEATENSLYCESFKIYYEDSPTDPYVSASDVNIACDATNGSIAYTIGNEPDPAGTLTAAITSGNEGNWLTLGAVSTSVAFTCSANTNYAARTATVTRTYTYGNNETATKDVVITQAAAPITLTSITLSGTYPTSFYVGDDFSHEGMTVTATYSDNSTDDVTSSADFSGYDMSQTGEQTVTVTYTSNNVSRTQTYTITVNEIPTKTIAQFISAGGGKCYLTGTVSNIDNTTYGNFDLTDASGTIYVYGCLTSAGQSGQFSTLNIEANDVIKVLANEYVYYNNTTHEAKNVVFVEEIVPNAQTLTVNATNGSVEITGKTLTNNACEVAEGASVTATATPADHYTFTSWTAEGVTLADNTDNPLTFTMPTNGVSLTANFTEKAKHSATFYVQGELVNTDANVYEGEAVTFPSVTAPTGYTFVGWTTASIAGLQDSAPADLVNSADMGDDDVAYYAVFAIGTVSGEGSIELTNSTINDNRQGKGSYSDDYNINNWTGRYMLGASGTTYFLQLGYNTNSTKSAYNSHLTTPECASNIKSITISTNNGTASGRTFYLCSADNLGTASSTNATYGSGSTSAQDGSVTITVSGNTKQFHIYPDGTAYIASVSLTYSNVSYSHYCTTVTTIPVTVTAAGWATLYTSHALDFSGTGLTAYTASLSSGNEVSLTKVDEVPANTGVVLKGAEGTYEVSAIASSTTEQGDLQGSVSDATAYNAFSGYDLYMLALNGNGEAQFTKVTSGSIAAGKAFLKVSSGQGVKVLNVVFNDESTGIEDVFGSTKEQMEGGNIYDLQGRKVVKPTHGLYIVNGKKVFIK